MLCLWLRDLRRPGQGGDTAGEEVKSKKIYSRSKRVFGFVRKLSSQLAFW